MANTNEEIPSGGPGTPTSNKLQQTAAMARIFAGDASRAIGSLLPTASLQQITARRYTLPDKTVASQVLMYRQLLHTKCRPGLKLSRDYQATAAQMAVMHMPWWEQGIEESKKMVISYDNLITRLWLNGAIEPFTEARAGKKEEKEVDLLDMGDTTPSTDGDTSAATVETYITDEGLPPVPHEFWVGRLGFQQNDPVTDFRSGGVLSLAMLVYMVESQPEVCQRFLTGDASVLPFGITCINVTDMIAKFLMLAKATDRMDALLSQKPFWRMFGDPNAILAVQELAMTMLGDVVVELTKERKVPALAKEHSSNTSMPGEQSDKVTVFDFATILERTELRVRDDLLGAGPKSVDELRSIAGRLRIRYKTQLDRRIQRAEQRQQALENAGSDKQAPQITEVLDKAGGAAGAVAGAAGAFAGGLFAKMKEGAAMAGSISTNLNMTPAAPSPTDSTTGVDLPSKPPAADAAAASTPTESLDDLLNDADEALNNFSIGDDEEDNFL